MRRLSRSLRHAARGIFFTLQNERNFQVEVVAAGVVLLLMAWLPLSRTEDFFLIIAMMAVLSLELVNTAVERIMDILKPRVHPYARVVKDVMAGAVFVASLGALLLGVLIFSPHFF
ncbi:MAG: diacylglycerol kinase family protein [Candidatus Moranbacteria bacterium]|nr:diacylglycerol kinase family protein [Candidatus Moranbacteria bacterium]